MISKFTNSFLLIFLAIIFTLGLTFASIELPKLADNLLHQNANFVNVQTGGGNLQEIKTELFVRHFHLRTIGYLSLAVIIALIIIGFVTEKTGLSSIGAFAIFLPVFGHFAATMFFLGGLGFLRLLWLPGLDISFNFMNLGDAVFIPYRFILDSFDLVGITLHRILPYIFISIGLLIFCIGIIIWFKTNYNHNDIAESFIYKYSRHPQYLGWIIWSYGILFLPGANMKQSYSISDSLPWLISTFIIIGVAMTEELEMIKKFGNVYQEYRKRSYFMIPLPKYFCRVITSPFKTFFQKYYPTKKIEILIVLIFYFALTILITALLNTFAVMQTPGKWVFIEKDSRNVNELKKDFINTPERRDKDKLLKLLIAKGDSAAPIFIDLLNSNNLVIREFSADALGILTPRNAVIPLIKALDDNNWRVQSSAINALGNYNSKYVTKSLIDLLNKNNANIRNASAMALSKICNSNAQATLIKKLSESLINPTNIILLCIAKSKSAEAVNELIKFSSDENIKIRQTSAIGLMLTKSKRDLPTLRKLLSDKDWEVRLYAEEAIHEIMKK